MAVFQWLHKSVDVEVFGWSTDGANPQHRQPLGRSLC